MKTFAIHIENDKQAYIRNSTCSLQLDIAMFLHIRQAFNYTRILNIFQLAT
jgi:hypothetical protein